MKQKTFHVFSALIVLGSYYLFITIEQEKTLWLLLGFHFLLFVVSFRSTVSNFISPLFLNLLRATSLIIIISLVWNILFRLYSDSTTFEGHIFRGIFYGFRAPSYGRLYPEWMGYTYGPATLVSSIYLLYAWLIFKRESLFPYTSPILFLVVLIGFSWHIDFWTTLTGMTCHYESFAVDLKHFSGIKDLLHTYSSKMGLLEVHNNHYPPGTLAMLLLQKKWGIPILKLFVFLSLSASIPLIYSIAKQHSFTRSQAIFISLLSGIGLLIVPSIAVSPLLVFPFLLSFYILSSKEISHWNIIVLGVVLFLASLISYITFFWMLFLVLYLLFTQGTQWKEWTALLFKFTPAIIIFLIGYILLYFQYGYQPFEVLSLSMANNKAQMQNDSFHALRYVIVSFGNLIAFAHSIGWVAIGMMSYKFSKDLKGKEALTALDKSLIITIFVWAFSNQFFLEVERIWIFMVPLMIILSTPKKVKLPFLFLLTLALIMTITSHTFINHCQ